jgi:GNAT superfamily N-acetyltransferase
MNELAIRNYLPTDRDGCRGLWRELTDWHRQIYQDPSIGGAHPEDHFDKHLTKVRADNLWVAILGSQVVGLIGLIINEKEAEIEPLIVSQPYRHKGIGRRLVKTVIAEASRLGVRFLGVKPVGRNIEAIIFLHKQGFRNIGHIELFIDFSDHQWKKGLKVFNRQFNF